MVLFQPSHSKKSGTESCDSQTTKSKHEEIEIPFIKVEVLESKTDKDDTLQEAEEEATEILPDGQTNNDQRTEHIVYIKEEPS